MERKIWLVFFFSALCLAKAVPIAHHNGDDHEVEQDEGPTDQLAMESGIQQTDYTVKPSENEPVTDNIIQEMAEEKPVVADKEELEAKPFAEVQLPEEEIPLNAVDNENNQEVNIPAVTPPEEVSAIAEVPIEVDPAMEVVMKEAVDNENPVMGEVPAVVELDPVIVEKVPLVEPDPIIVEEVPVVQVDPVMGEAPVVEINPVMVEEVPVVEVDPVMVEEVPVVEVDPVMVEEVPVVDEEVPGEESINNENPAMVEVSVMEEAPAVQLDPVIVEEVPVPSADRVMVEEVPVEVANESPESKAEIEDIIVPYISIVQVDEAAQETVANVGEDQQEPNQNVEQNLQGLSEVEKVAAQQENGDQTGVASIKETGEEQTMKDVDAMEQQVTGMDNREDEESLVPQVGEEKNVEQSLEQEGDQKIEEVVEQAMGQAVEEAIDQEIGQAIEQAMTQVVEEAIDQEIDQAIEQAMGQAMGQGMDQGMNQEMGQAMDQGMNQGMNQEMGQAMDQGMDQEMNQVMDQAMNRGLEQVMEQVVDQDVQMTKSVAENESQDDSEVLIYSIDSSPSGVSEDKVDIVVNPEQSQVVEEADSKNIDFPDDSEQSIGETESNIDDEYQIDVDERFDLAAASNEDNEGNTNNEGTVQAEIIDEGDATTIQIDDSMTEGSGVAQVDVNEVENVLADQVAEVVLENMGDEVKEAIVESIKPSNKVEHVNLVLESNGKPENIQVNEEQLVDEVMEGRLGADDDSSTIIEPIDAMVREVMKEVDKVMNGVNEPIVEDQPLIVNSDSQNNQPIDVEVPDLQEDPMTQAAKVPEKHGDPVMQEVQVPEKHGDPVMQEVQAPEKHGDPVMQEVQAPEKHGDPVMQEVQAPEKHGDPVMQEVQIPEKHGDPVMQEVQAPEKHGDPVMQEVQAPEKHGDPVMQGVQVQNQEESSLMNDEPNQQLEPSMEGRINVLSTMTTTVTSTLVSETSILTTWSTCFVTEVAMPLCSSSALNPVARRRKANWILEKPRLSTRDGRSVPMEDIQITKASEVMAESEENINIDSGSQTEGEDLSHPKLLRVLETQTVTATSTLIETVSADGFETLRFTSDTANPGCLPSKLLARNSINECN